MSGAAGADGGERSPVHAGGGRPASRLDRARRRLRLVTGGDPVVAAVMLVVVAYYVATRGIFQGKASGDGFFGFMYLPNLVYHHTFDIAPSVPSWVHILGREATGHVANPCPIGPALFWAPFYLVGLALEAGVGRFLHLPPQALPGQTEFDFWMAGLGSLAAGLAGIVLLFRLLERRLGARAARAGVVAGVLATPIVWYLVTQPLYQHACAFFAVTLLVERWDAWRESEAGLTPARMALLGAIGGLAMLVRIQESVWLLIPGVDVARRSVRAALATGDPASRRRAVGRALLGGILFAAVAALVFAPQLLLWHYYFGSIRTPQPPGHMRWLDPAIVATIFSTRGGLLPWVPILYLVPAGLLAARRPLGALAVALALAFAGELWINASAWDHWGSYSFGPRRFTDATVAFAAGVAGLWWWIEQRAGPPETCLRAESPRALPSRRSLGRRALAAALALAVGYNALLMELMRNGRIKSSGSWAFPAATWAGWARAPSWLAGALARAGYPFVQPAGWIFAALHRAPATAFEGVVGNYFVERDCRVHGVVTHSSLAFADPGHFVVEGIARPPEGARPPPAGTLVPAAARVRVLVPLFAREPVRLHLNGDFAHAEARVVAEWNGAPLAATVAAERVTFAVPEAQVRTRSRVNELALTLPEGTRLKSLDVESLGSYWR